MDSARQLSTSRLLTLACTRCARCVQGASLGPDHTMLVTEYMEVRNGCQTWLFLSSRVEADGMQMLRGCPAWWGHRAWQLQPFAS